MKKVILIVLFYSLHSSHAQVGIGTTTPSSNAALDITSNNKGLLLPRLGDTGLVTNPSAGLLIYNMNTKFPSFHNGTSWNSLSTANTTNTTDSITYTVTNASNGFTNGTFKIENLSHGLSNTGTAGANFQDISFTKPLDINSTGFAKATATGPTPGSMVMEFKFYKPGSLTPYYSLKATTILVSSYQFGANSGGGFFESTSILPRIFGYKDWINNVSFGWNDATKTVVAY